MIVPWHITAFMKLVFPFIDPLTKKKIVMNEDMRLHVPPEQLRKSHGGDLEFEYEHDVYWPALIKLAEDRRKAQYERWVKGGKMIGEFESYLKGGQEESLKSTLDSKGGVEEVSEKVGDVALEEKKRKSVTVADEKVNGNADAVETGTLPQQPVEA